MPLKKRRLYFFFFLAVFFLAIPVLMLYTSGYRLSSSFRLVKTGGIYISAPGTGAEIYVNNQLEKTTNLIQRDFFRQNLTPGTYFVFVFKDGYWPWSKELKVSEQMVADAHAFLVPREPSLEEILPTLPITNNDTSGGPNPFYQQIIPLFSGKPIPLTAKITSLSASATTTVTHDKVQFIREQNTIFAKWLGDSDKAPFYFCDEYKRNCLQKIAIFTSASRIKTFDFYPGRDDVVILARKNGIYAVEADKRKIQNFALVYAGGDPDFRIASDGNMYIKDGKTLYKISL